LQAQRVADTVVGAAVGGGEKVAEALKPLQSQAGVRREVSRLRRQATANVRKLERRGATARKRAQRTAGRQRSQVTSRLRRNRREAERQVRATRDGFDRRVEDVRTSAEGFAQRAGSEARNLA